MSAATHGAAVVVGGVLVVAIGLVSQPRREGGGTERLECPELRPVLERASSMSPVASGCPNECPSAPNLAVSNGRAMLLELQKAKAEAALGELGGMPLAWETVPDVPEGLRPERFEALVIRVTSELGIDEPDIDCSEFPCVALAPAEWTGEELTVVREKVRMEAGVEGATLFVLDEEGRVFGVYSDESQTPELLERIWFRLMEGRREAMQGE